MALPGVVLLLDGGVARLESTMRSVRISTYILIPPPTRGGFLSHVGGTPDGGSQRARMTLLCLLRHDGAAVTKYWVHFVGLADHVFADFELAHDTDESAIKEAYRLDIPSIGRGFYVLRDDRLVHRHRRSRHA